MKMLNTIHTWPALRWPWLLLAGSALSFELVALYFQYAMQLNPCVMCVYQRAAVFGLIISALPAAIAPTSFLARTVSFSGWVISAIWGLVIAYEHVQMQNPDNFLLLMSCDVFPNFPTWLPLHTMLPWMFEPTGTCGGIDWQFIGYSMPQWMTIVFAIYTVIAAFVLAMRIVKTKSL